MPSTLSLMTREPDDMDDISEPCMKKVWCRGDVLVLETDVGEMNAYRQLVDSITIDGYVEVSTQYDAVTGPAIVLETSDTVTAQIDGETKTWP